MSKKIWSDEAWDDQGSSYPSHYMAYNDPNTANADKCVNNLELSQAKVGRPLDKRCYTVITHRKDKAFYFPNQHKTYRRKHTETCV